MSTSTVAGPAPVILVLAHHYDAEADWLCKVLREDCDRACTLVWPEALGVDYDITLAIHRDGQREVELSFPDRPSVSPFDCRSATYAVNRLSYVEPLIWKNAESSEKAYAGAEINAFFAAFVRALPCPVSNPVRNGALWNTSGFETRWARALRRGGVALHPLIDADPADALALLGRADQRALRRWMHFEGRVFVPPDQDQDAEDLGIREAILHDEPDEILEFIAVAEPGDRRPRLLWVSRTPALSCYGRDFVRALADRASGATT